MSVWSTRMRGWGNRWEAGADRADENRLQIYAYPIKALRPMAVTRARLLQQGLEHDRRYMLLKVEADGSLTNVQIVSFPACARLFQDVEGDDIVVTHRPPEGEAPGRAPLRVPLRPDTAGLATVEVRLFGSATRAYRMGPAFDGWFAACLGFDARLVYIGDGQRAVLAHSPRAAPPPPGTWRASLSSLAAYVTGSGAAPAPDWLTFNEAAPFLVATEASLRDVSARLPQGTPADMMRFRPNIVVDGDVAWDEDFWTELQVHGGDKPEAQAAAATAAGAARLALTANCGRCRSINIDYDTGRFGEGEAGALLKKLMKDRRVDTGNKWSPIFGRYAFLMSPDAAGIAVGDEVSVTKRSAARSVWQWPD